MIKGYRRSDWFLIYEAFLQTQGDGVIISFHIHVPVIVLGVCHTQMTELVRTVVGVSVVKW